MKIDLERAIKCAERELAMRKGVYPKWVASGRMSQKKADEETAAMEDVVHLIKWVTANAGTIRVVVQQLDELKRRPEVAAVLAEFPDAQLSLGD